MASAYWAASLIRSCHPGPTAAVTVGALGLAVAAGHPAGGVALTTATVLSSQLAIGWHNDWVDRARDALVDRRDKPVARGAISANAVLIAAGVACILTLLFAAPFGPWPFLLAWVALSAGLAYNWPLKATTFSWLPYGVSFSALPCFVVLGLAEPSSPPWWLVLAGATLGIGAHFANVLGDLEDDRRTGVHGLPHRLGLIASTITAMILLSSTSLLLTFGSSSTPPAWSLTGSGVSILILAVGMIRQWQHQSSKAAFWAVIAAALIDIALLASATTRI